MLAPKPTAGIVVSGGPYITILPVDPGYIVVPYYDPTVVFFAPRPGFFVGGGIRFGYGVTLGGFFAPWGVGAGRNGLRLACAHFISESCTLGPDMGQPERLHSSLARDPKARAEITRVLATRIHFMRARATNEMHHGKAGQRRANRTENTDS
jgi:hypothetical protein